MVKPIALYNSEVWGADIPSKIQTKIIDNNMISDENFLKLTNELPHEQLHIKFCKMLLGVKKKYIKYCFKSRTWKTASYYRKFYENDQILAKTY